MRLLHVSDPHVQLPGWRRRPFRELGPLRSIATAELWKGRGRKFDGAADSLRAWAAAAAAYDHCLLTGDLTQLCTREEFALARDALGPLAGDPARLTLLPGNHDRYPWGGRTQRWYEEAFPEHLGSDLPFAPLRVRLLGEAALVIVDSTRALSLPVLTRGLVDAAALAALRAALAAPEVRARCALVLTHYAPLKPRARPRPELPVHYLRGWRALLRTCVEGGAQALLCGHVHGRYLLEPTPERPLVICCGSSTEEGKRGAWALELRDGMLRPPLELGPLESDNRIIR